MLQYDTYFQRKTVSSYFVKKSNKALCQKITKHIRIMVEQAKMKISVLLRVLLKGQNHDSENNYNSESRRDKQIRCRVDTHLIFLRFCQNQIQNGIYKGCQKL